MYYTLIIKETQPQPLEEETKEVPQDTKVLVYYSKSIHYMSIIVIQEIPLEFIQQCRPLLTDTTTG